MNHAFYIKTLIIYLLLSILFMSLHIKQTPPPLRFDIVFNRLSILLKNY